MLLAYASGFGLSGGLIVAIGAQNAFVLSQGVRRHYPLTIALICAVCDALLIILGIAGVGTLIAQQPVLARVAAWGGALFLLFYGLQAFRSAWQGGALKIEQAQQRSLKAVVATTLAVTFLNPHCWKNWKPGSCPT